MNRVIGLLLAGLIACTDLALDPHTPLGSVEVSPSDALVLTDESIPLELTVYDTRGQAAELPPWSRVYWTVDDPSITISDDVLTGSIGANARITAHVAGLTGGTRIRINPKELDVDITVLLSQATQNLEGTIPLIADRGLIFRAYVTTPVTNYYESVSMRATLSLRGREEVTPVLRTSADSIDAVIVNTLRRSYFHEVVFPPSIIQPGLSLTVELDPLGELPPELSLNPSTVMFKIPVLKMQPHRMVIVPTVAAQGANPEIIDWAATVTNESPELALLRNALPITDLEVEIHDSLYIDADLSEPYGFLQWLETVEAIRIMEGREGWYYYGVYHPEIMRGIAGVALQDGFTAVSVPLSWAIAHEIGHNLSLRHAPCGGPPDVDPNYPYFGGLIGQWGFDLESGTTHHPEFSVDLMGYCSQRRPAWISDYQYQRALKYRSSLRLSDISVDEPVTLIWGHIDDKGIALKPSFRFDAPPVLPSGLGDYTVVLIGPDNQVVYESRFSPSYLSDTDLKQFHFAIPSSEISRIIVIGPEGRDEIGRGTEPPMAILRDESGQVRAVYYHWLNTPSQREGITQATNILISEGVPR